jgi:hypothetical protein
MLDAHIKNNNGLKLIQDNINRNTPVPGQSLTNSKNNSRAWENPPQITNKREGVHDIFKTLTDPTVFYNVVEALEKGVPVLDISSTLLYQGFKEGKWNPDLMVLLQESTMYMVLAMGEKAGLENMRVYAGEEKDNAELFQEETKEYITEQKSTPSRLKDLKPSLDKTSVSNEILKEIENLDAPSLLAQAEPSKETEIESTEDNSSLLERKI